ncbi:MAG TPA: fused response regulator/phosphatase [Desulfobacterales bacterium]|nr:fused response regulator/phosphatase [Desulfobacterales bacterium]HIP40306.1 fused response regulator/phosphatase [Desulfocapsa sulfexigens]
MIPSTEHRETILVIDDEEAVRMAIRLYLEDKGFHVLQAADGQSGLESCRKYFPDLVLLDLSMPGMDGFELCRIVRDDDLLRDIPVIMLTAYESTELKMQAFDLGAVDYLTKPVNNGELLVRIRTHLRINSLTRFLKQANRELLASQQQLQQGMRAAAELQRNLLPKQIPDCKNLCFASYFQPCEHVGGDIYNIQRLDDRHLAVYILDVSGHGFSAAMMTALVTQAISGCHQRDTGKTEAGAGEKGIHTPVEIIRELDREFPLIRFNLYITIAYLIYNTKNHTFHYCCAGHPSPAHVTQEGAVTFLDKGGPPAGMDGIWHEGEGRLNSGDRIYFYTDGLTEYNDGEDELYGQKRLIDSMAASSTLPLKTGVENIIGEMKRFGRQADAADDMTLLVIERTKEELPAQ